MDNIIIGLHGSLSQAPKNDQFCCTSLNSTRLNPKPVLASAPTKESSPLHKLSIIKVIIIKEAKSDSWGMFYSMNSRPKKKTWTRKKHLGVKQKITNVL